MYNLFKAIQIMKINVFQFVLSELLWKENISWGSDFLIVT